jgi:hypothetical protein
MSKLTKEEVVNVLDNVYVAYNENGKFLKIDYKETIERLRKKGILISKKEEILNEMEKFSYEFIVNPDIRNKFYMIYDRIKDEL